MKSEERSTTLPFNTPLPISGRDPDSVPFEERIAELEEARQNPMRAIKAQQQRRSQKQAEQDREDAKARWLAAGSTEQEFEKAWPQLRKEQLRLRAEEAEAEARSESLRQMQRSF